MIDALAEETGTERSGAAPASGRTRLLLVGSVGGRRFALPAAAVVTCLRMAPVTPLPDAPPGVVGVLNTAGRILPVVDPRPAFGVPTPPYDPEQYLVLVRARRDYVLWIDRLEQTFAAPAAGAAPVDLDGVAGGAAGTGGPDDAGADAVPGAVGSGRRALVDSFVRIAGEVVPVLSLAALAPDRLSASGGPETAVTPPGGAPGGAPGGGAVSVLRCRLRTGRYAIDLRLLRSVLRAPVLTPVPCTPPVVAGIISVRGEAITVLDLAVMLDLEHARPPDEGIQVVLAGHERGQVGLLVDEVLGIGHLRVDELAPPLSRSGFARGIDHEGTVYLDLEALLVGDLLEVAEEVP
jgi:purine-binding chemotaxis protein CheW